MESPRLGVGWGIVGWYLVYLYYIYNYTKSVAIALKSQNAYPQHYVKKGEKSSQKSA